MPSAQPVPGFEPTQRHTPASHNALAPGTRLNDYEIVKVLGEGGFSIVYLAQDLTLQRRVAIKEYLPAAIAVRGSRIDVALRTVSQSETFAQGLASFVNEARLLARFDHPSLVRVLHFWKANGTAYMVMPFVEGSTLAAARGAMARPPDEAWLRALLQSLLGALEVLHAASCFHRDIAPDNVLLLPDGRPLLLDFGAARRVVGEKTQQLTAILKPHFAPIEQYAESKHLQQGPWTDLYALGALARYCITGQPPMPSTVRALHDELPPLADEVRALDERHPGLDYSASLLDAIDWALGVRPADRPQSVAQMREALNRPAGDIRSPASAPRPVQPAAVPPLRAVDDDLLDVQSAVDAAVRAAQRDEPHFDDAAKHAPAPPPRRSTRGAETALPRRAVWGMTLVVLAVLGYGGWHWFQLLQADRAVDAMARQWQAPGDAAPAGQAPGGDIRTPSTVPPVPVAAPPSAAPTQPPPRVTVPKAAAPAPRAEPPDGAPEPAAPSERAPVMARNGRLANTVPVEPDNPRAVCAPRQQFALYYCMQQQCLTDRFYAHPQCIDLRRRDEVE
jgi:non-specific serine/threonine protein kinase